MKKEFFRWIVLAMGIALTGLVLLQAYWIFNDYSTRSTQYDAQVMQSLHRVIESVEQQENMRLVVNQMFSSGDTTFFSGPSGDSISGLLSGIAQATPSLQPTLGSNDNGSLLEQKIAGSLKEYRQKKNQSPIHADAGSLGSGMQEPGLDIRIEKDIRQREIIDLKLSGNNSDLADSIGPGLGEPVNSRMQRLQSMVQKLSFQIVDPSLSVIQRIGTGMLDSLLKQEFSASALGSLKGYGILNEKDKKIIYQAGINDTARIYMSHYKLGFFPNDVLKGNESLVVVFDDKPRTILEGILPMLAFSLFLTIVMSAGFVYTVQLVLRQKKLAEMKSDFINNMTHEFKTPIATIAIANESLKNQKVIHDTEKVSFYTNVIAEENKRMLRQVEKVLQMAQIEKGELQLKKEAVEPESILQSAISSFSLTIGQRGGRIEYNWNAGHVRMYADMDHLRNVFINLLDNANKYCPDTPMIQVNALLTNERLRISIKDNGVGISPEVRKRIFDTFYRASGGNIHDVKGFGLGLSYVKAIVEAHEGKIDVDSVPGHGSEFVLEFPIQSI